MTNSQRLDKWLWFTRLIKTRSAGARLVTSGKVRVNRERVTKPAFAVKEGDVITASVHRVVRVYKVRSPGHRRGPASEAGELYEDLTVRSEHRKPKEEENSAAMREPGSGRPTKRERRKTDALRGRN